MDALTQKSRQQRLKRELNKSLANVRLSKNKKLTLADKSKIKKVAVKSLQRYLTAEIKRTNTKTYDWYFFKDDGELFHIEAFRNSLNHNRYFIVDHEQVMIESKFSHGSSYGQQRIQQYDISSKEIGDIISSSKKLFADMMKITVSEKEDAKIWRAFDNVDEKKIISVTIGLPLAIIAAAETVPLMVMASKSSAATSLSSSLGKAFALNSGRVAAVNGASEFGDQYISNILINDGIDAKFGLSHLDWGDIGIATVLSKPTASALGSVFDFDFDNGLKVNSFDDSMLNYGTSRLGGYTGEKFGNLVSTPIKKFSKPIGTVVDKTGNILITLGIRTISSNNEEKDK
ncbi:hypothetical protein [Zobellia roscoffensis]|uniref:hypothetical protein n=1 Tax=Zobellia roscoffensis TaxID=2779508 RepID=UPI00188A751A|nr:hypothetical protein [Zobellia roscoffensis]